jgi:hypothetical protein
VDNWRIEACPVNGPAISARESSAVAAWFTLKDEKGQAFAAFSNDAARNWGTPIRLDDGISEGHVDVEIFDDGSAVASWLEYVDERSQFRIRRIDQSGTRSGPITIAGASTGRVSGYPRLARLGKDLIVAWTESVEGNQTVKAATIRPK